jgi:parallel beta-helix repeat protein
MEEKEMKKGMALVAFLAMALMGAIPTASADSYVIAGGVGTKISYVPYTISSPGFYYLAQNLTLAPVNANAITVQADNVTLDLMGFALSGVGKTKDGIVLSGTRSNVEIRNGTLRSFSGKGIYALDARGIRVISLRVRDTAGTGIELGGTDHLVMDCSVKSAGGFGIFAGTGSLVKGNLVMNNTDYGIKAYGGSNVVGNVAASNSVGIAASFFSSVIDNTVANNTSNGISVADNCTVSRNTAYNNTGTGIITGIYCTITNNTTDGLTYGNNSTPVNNTVAP